MKKSVLIGVVLLIVFSAVSVMATDKVVVIPLNSCKDANLLPENVVWGVTISGVIGTSMPVGTVVSAGRLWMDRNLGASQVASGSADTLAYGDMYQWGRMADGHESRTSVTTKILSTGDDPGNGSFILAPQTPQDWQTQQNDNLWQGVSGTNNPCPSGFRLPIEAEWQAELVSWGVGNDNAAGAFASPLKLVLTGYRSQIDGAIVGAGTLYGDYWSSTVNGRDSRFFNFSDTSVGIYDGSRAYGLGVRCIKD